MVRCPTKWVMASSVAYYDPWPVSLARKPPEPPLNAWPRKSPRKPSDAWPRKWAKSRLGRRHRRWVLGHPESPGQTIKRAPEETSTTRTQTPACSTPGRPTMSGSTTTVTTTSRRQRHPGRRPETFGLGLFGMRRKNPG